MERKKRGEVKGEESEVREKVEGKRGNAKQDIYLGVTM